MANYFQTKEIEVGKNHYFTYDFGIDHTNCIVGFDMFNFSFGKDTNHCIKEIGLEIKTQFQKDNRAVNVSVKGTMRDDPKIGTDHKMKTGKVRVQVVAIPKNEQESIVCNAVVAMQSFSLKFSGDDDHHVMEYAAGVKLSGTGNSATVSSDPNITYIMDASGNEGSGTATGNFIYVPKTIISEMEAKNIFLINSFMMGTLKDDHEVSSTGIDAIKSKINEIYNLSDKHKNNAQYGRHSANNNRFPESSVLTRIFDINKKGTLKVLKGDKSVDVSISSHVQGIVEYNDYYVVSHSNGGKSKGFFMCMNGVNTRKFNTHFENFNHPGGMQRMGNYMLVGVENDTHDESHICLYDLTNMSMEADPTFVNNPNGFCGIDKTPKTKGLKGGACAVGITKYRNKEKRDRYLIAVFDPQTGKDETSYFDFYDIDASKPLEETNFNLPENMITRVILPGYIDYQCFGLVTDPYSNKLFLIAFLSIASGSKGEYVDYIDIYEISESNKALTKLCTRHMITDLQKVKQLFDLHFRWGAAIDYDNSNNMIFLATDRNLDKMNLAINTFVKIIQEI
ncbi:MAG: hypothetical protein LBE79_00440 [Tannerella sp.]|jgi:hypothetical protein|nr:hypothetical protein [Tannerella sp.]